MSTSTTTIAVPEPRTAPTTRCADCGARLPLTQANPAPGCDTDNGDVVRCDNCLDLHILGCTACTSAVRYDDWME